MIRIVDVEFEVEMESHPNCSARMSFVHGKLVFPLIESQIESHWENLDTLILGWLWLWLWEVFPKNCFTFKANR